MKRHTQQHTVRLGHIDRFSIALIPMRDIVSLKTDSRSNWPVAALMEAASIFPLLAAMAPPRNRAQEPLAGSKRADEPQTLTCSMRSCDKATN